jgi:hypothetical protein
VSSIRLMHVTASRWRTTLGLAWVAVSIAMAGSLGSLSERLTSKQARSEIHPRSPFLQTTTSDASRLRWFKGNTHTHTLNYEGDSTPDDVVRWYREHNGYQFVILTDHNFLTSVDALNALHGAEDKFLVMAGEEITDRVHDARKAPIHLNGLNLQSVVRPQGGTSVVDTLQRNVNDIRRVQGIPTINHPNYEYAITAADILQTRDVRLLEVFSTNPDVNPFGGGGMPSAEEIWDQVLSSGREIFALAADDAHEFKQPWNPNVKRPGLGWVVVRSDALTPSAIAAALDRGEFYASTGVVLDSIVVTPQYLRIEVEPKSWNKARGRIQFIGSGGRLLQEAATSPATYEFTGNESYVRARVINSGGSQAWVQPVFLSSSPTPSTR